MGKRKKTMFGESLIENTHTYFYYLCRITEMALSRFEWIGLPSSVDERYLELSLFTQGNAIFFYDDILEEYLCLNMVTQGRLNHYGEPIERRAWSMYNNYQKLLDYTDSVIIWNNYMRQNTYPVICQFAKRLYEYDRVIDVNVNAQKTPVLLRGSEKERLSLINLYKQWDGNEPLVTAYDTLNTEKFSVLKTDAPFVAQNIYDLKVDLWNECMSFLGITNVAIRKRERVTTDEVRYSMGGTLSSRSAYLKMRRQAAEKIHEMFGIKVEVNWTEDFGVSSEEDEDDGILYDTDQINTGE